MKHKTKILSLIAALFGAAVLAASCSGNVEPEGTGGAVPVLSVDTEGIAANGKTAATFTVKFDDKDVSASSTIKCTTTGVELAGCKFTTMAPGKYEFSATYQNLTSNTVTIQAFADGEGVRVAVDKAQIEADGKDAAKLILTDEDGKVVTDDSSLLRFVSYSVVETGESQNRTNQFTAIADGTYTIAVKYKGTPCANTVTVKAVNRGKYEKYFHMVPVYDITNIQCYYCSVIAKGLEEVPNPYKEHTLAIGVHGPYDTKDPWLEFTSSVATNLMKQYQSNGYPTIIYNLDTKAAATEDEYTGVGIGVRVREQIMKYPATSGVKLSSSYNAGTSKLSVTVAMMPTVAAKYDLGCAVLLDNQDVTGMSSLFSKVNDILINISGNYYGMSTESFTASVGKEVSRTWEFDLSSNFVSQSGGVQNFRVVGFVLTQEGQKVRFDNAAVCPMGTSVDYRLN